MLKHVAEGVLVHVSEFIQSNSIVVQGRDGVLLIDPGITGDEMAALANDLRELGRPVAAGFSTHPDWDHVLWHPDFGDAPRYGTARCAASLQDLLSHADWEARVAEGLPPEYADEIPMDLLGLVTGLPAGATHIPWDGPTVRIIEHHAHAPGHAALLIEDRHVLVAGDMLSDMTAVFPTTPGSARRPRWIGCLMCTNGNFCGSLRGSRTRLPRRLGTGPSTDPATRQRPTRPAAPLRAAGRPRPGPPHPATW